VRPRPSPARSAMGSTRPRSRRLRPLAARGAARRAVEPVPEPARRCSVSAAALGGIRVPRRSDRCRHGGEGTPWRRALAGGAGGVWLRHLALHSLVHGPLSAPRVLGDEPGELRPALDAGLPPRPRAARRRAGSLRQLAQLRAGALRGSLRDVVAGRLLLPRDAPLLPHLRVLVRIALGKGLFLAA